MAKAKVPTPEEAQSAVDALRRELLDALNRAQSALPPELRVDPTVVEQRVNAEFDKISFASWRTQIVAEFTQAIVTGKSDVRHDPTELA